MAAELTEFPFDLGTMGECEVWMCFIEQVDTIDLPIDRKLDDGFLLLYEFIERLYPVRPAVKFCHQPVRLDVMGLADFAHPPSRAARRYVRP